LTVPDAGPLTESASGNGLIVTVAKLNAFFALLSVTVALTVYVPFTEYVVVKLVPEPDAGLPPTAVHENV
jgi:hypothetical protein